MRSSLVRALLVVSLFAARVVSAAPSSGETVSVSLALFDGAIVAGHAKSFPVWISRSKENPPLQQCSDDFAGEGWGCGGGKPCDSWVTTPQSPTTTSEKATVLEATCDAYCEVTIDESDPGSVTITGKTKDTTAKLHLRVRDASGVEFTTDVAIDVTGDALVLARTLAAPQMPDNVFLVGQTFSWCVKNTRSDFVLESTVATYGAVAVESNAPGCKTFRSTTSGKGHVVFTTSDGRTLTVDVLTVAPSDVVAIDFIVSPDEGQSVYTTTTREVLSSAAAVDPIDAYSDGSTCRTIAARFETAEGQYGLVPQDAIEKSPSEERLSATIGAVTKTTPLRTVQRCYGR